MVGTKRGQTDGRRHERRDRWVWPQRNSIHVGELAIHHDAEKWGMKDGRQEINSKTTMTAKASLNADSFREEPAGYHVGTPTLAPMKQRLRITSFFHSFLPISFLPSFKGAEIGS